MGPKPRHFFVFHKFFDTVQGNGNEEKQFPVMFWIHGGGFFAGSASPDFYGPEHILDHDIVLVTINYRYVERPERPN